MLLFVARGLLRRLDGAWWIAMIIVSVSLALSLAKGLAFVEAGMLGFLVILLATTRHRPDRRLLGAVLRLPRCALQPRTVVGVRI